jgi:hypothetical protein
MLTFAENLCYYLFYFKIGKVDDEISIVQGKRSLPSLNDMSEFTYL